MDGSGQTEIASSCETFQLTTAEPVVHQTGLLRKWTRASISLPGIGPQLFDCGSLLIDGGAALCEGLSSGGAFPISTWESRCKHEWN